MTLQLHADDYRVEEYSGLAIVESLRPLWEQWQTHPNADFDFYSAVIKNRTGIVDPVALMILNRDIPVALAACRIEYVKLPITFGYLRVSQGKIMQLTVVYGGMMGAWDAAGSAVFIRYLRQSLQKKHIDAVHFEAMRNDHPAGTAAHRQTPFLLRDIAVKDNLHWWADLPVTFDAFLIKINRKHRAQLRSKERKLAEHCSDTVKVQLFHTPEEVSPFCIVADKIAQGTYLRGIGEGFYDSGEIRNRLDLAARKGWMRGYILYAAQKPCAFWLGTLYRNTFYLDYTGFDSSLKEFGAGQILFIKMVECLCNEGDIRGIDFGSGDAEYKQRYGDRNWKESDFYLFSATPAMLSYNTIRKSVKLLRTGTILLLRRFGWFTRIKRRWRLAAEKGVYRQDITVDKGDTP